MFAIAPAATMDSSQHHGGVYKERVKEMKHQTGLDGMTQMAFGNASTEAAIVNEVAWRAIDHAVAEAAKIELRANRNVELANEKLLRIINEIQELMTRG